MQAQVKKKLFDGQSIYVGIDYHQKSWKVSVFGEQYEHKTMSRDPDPVQLACYLKKNFPGASYHAVYEAGFSGFGACRKLRELGIDCIVANPADVPTSEKERLQKTDKADSRKLARSLRGGGLTAVHVPDRGMEADRALVRQRFRLVKDIARDKNRVKSLLYEFGIEVPERFAKARHWPKAYTLWLTGLAVEEERLKLAIDNYVRVVGALRKELLAVNGQVRAMVRSGAYETNYGLLLTVPGIGPVTAAVILTQLGDISRFKRLDELCNYVGLVPSMHGSGEKMTVGKMVHRGRKELKVMLIEASWSAIRHDPAMMAKFNELVKKMPAHKAVIRIARKLLNRIRYVLSHQQEYVMGVEK